MPAKTIVGLLSVELMLSGVTDNLAAQNKQESWLTCWGLGYTDTKYPDFLDDLLDALDEALPDAHNW